MAAVLKKAGAVALTNASDLEVVGDTQVGYVVMNPDAIKYLYGGCIRESYSDTFSANSMFKGGKNRWNYGWIGYLGIKRFANYDWNSKCVQVELKKATHMAVLKAVAGKFIDDKDHFVQLYRSLWVFGAVVSYPEALVSCVWTVVDAS